MGKFRIRIKLQGFELEVDGDREDIPAITAAVQHQLGGLVSPPSVDEEPEKIDPRVIDMPSPSKRPPRKRSTAAKQQVDGQGSAAIDFRHDSGKYGTPKQSWSVAQKCIWLLFVLEGISGIKEASASQLTNTFNAQFKAAGKIHPPHTTRDLGFAKVSSPAPIGEDKGMWFLTDKGKEQAQELVEQGKAS